VHINHYQIRQRFSIRDFNIILTILSHSFQANLVRKNGRRLKGVQGEPCTKNGDSFSGVQGEPCTKNGDSFSGVQGEPC